MKKILVIMMMVLLCSTSVIGKTKKRSARKPKAKVERQMTDFEKRQKEEYLANILMWCQHYYNDGKIEDANRYKKDYERVKNENYYVEFTNVVHSDKKKAEWKKKFGSELRDGRYFYADGLLVFIHFDTDGKACDWTDYSYCCLEYKVKKEIMGYDTRTYYKAKKDLIDEINELSGYNARLAKKTSEMEEFINQHKAETTKPVAEKKKEQTNMSLSETTQANRRFYQEHKADYSTYNRQVNPEKKSKLKLKSEQEKPKTPVYSTRIVGSTD